MPYRVLYKNRTAGFGDRTKAQALYLARGLRAILQKDGKPYVGLVRVIKVPRRRKK